MKLSKEKSEEQAVWLQQLGQMLLYLDIEYLTHALSEMKKNQSFRESAMVMDPNPTTALERNELNSAKLKQLELYIELAQNTKVIQDATIAVHSAKNNESILNRIFGQ